MGTGTTVCSHALLSILSCAILEGLTAWEHFLEKS